MTENKHSHLIGRTFGQLKLVDIEEFKSLTNRPGYRIHLECKCGKLCSYPFKRLNGIMRGSQVSCGCVRKDKWRKGFYAFMTEQNKEGK